MKHKVVILVNLGSPTQLTKMMVRRFLAKFLSDKRVINIPKLIWYPILYGIILPFRTKRLLKEYKHIQIDSMSPLIYYSILQASHLEKKLGEQYLVRHAFSYVAPNLHDVLESLAKDKLTNNTDITIIPLYPQFSSTTTSAVFDALSKYYADKKYLPNLKFIRGFYNNPFYIKSIVNKIQESWHIKGRGGKLIFSYHSLPERIIQQGDSYLSECQQTTKLVVDELGLKDDEYIITFQSKFGRQKWLSPATSNMLIDLAKSGILNVDIICPGFVSDCLETLQEIKETNKKIFLNNGGVHYNYIPCLNDSEDFIAVLANLVLHN